MASPYDIGLEKNPANFAPLTPLQFLDWSALACPQRTAVIYMDRPVHIRPTFFSEWLLFPFVRSTIVENGIFDLPYGDGRHAPIAGEDQARVIATILAEPAAHIGRTYPLCGPTELDQAGIAAAMTEVLGRKISYRPLTIPQYRERLERAVLHEFMIQHFCAVAIDYQNGLFSGEDKFIAKLTGKPPMTVRDFVALNREAFRTASAAG